jgi:hypothetical protein
MPYYRIIVWTKRRKQPFKGIRLLPDHNINSVFNSIYSKSVENYRTDFIDCEIQMLSKLCSAVKEFEKKEQDRG